MNLIVSLDGPAASGKSTVSKIISAKLGLLHVDSGALYRIVTYLALAENIDTSSPEALAAFAPKCAGAVDFVVRDGRVAYDVGGAELGDKIRTPEINAHVSPVSVSPEVRTLVTGWLRSMRALGSLVVEGRDIGSVVFPDAPFRFYLDADPDERARRRLKEDIAKGFAKPDAQDAVKTSLLNRDKIDRSRKTAPLKIPDGARFIDTTTLSIDEVVEIIANTIQP
ncbi:MAG: (d)CMP kinase [Kiritimatiellaeota bacterium]|nr:(d)CMP kinase [Kiritimatiellota bacterium]